MPSSTVENYLKAIWSLQQNTPDDILVPIGQVAEKLSVTPGTATTMMNQLLKQDFVIYTPRKGVTLSPTGQEAALKVLRRHRLIETFLVEVMKLDWAEVHEDAEVLEHVISDRLLQRMDEMLSHPTHDPHGAPIPSAEGVLNRDPTTSLSQCPPGPYTLTRVREDRPEFLQWIAKQGLKPGVKFEFAAHDPLADMLTLVIAGQEARIQLSLQAAESLLVSRL